MNCVAHFDNSAENLANPDPTKVVHFGDQTWEEMMFGFYASLDPKEDLTVKVAGDKSKDADEGPRSGTTIERDGNAGGR